MKCPACGTEVDGNAVYCPKCGERVDLPGPAELSGEPPEGQGFSPPEAGEPAAEEPAPPRAEAPKTPAERLQESVLDRQDAASDVEEELWQGRYCGKAMIGTWVLCGVISVAILAVAIWFSVEGWMPAGVRWGIALVALFIAWGYPSMRLAYRRMSIRYRLTSQRFFHESGILRHVTDRIEVIDMDDIAYEQTILQRMVNVGTIHITSSDRSHPILAVEGIRDVKRVASMMDDARRAERIRRGLHIEAV